MSFSTRSCTYQSTEFFLKFLKGILDPCLGQNYTKYVCCIFQTCKKYFFHNFTVSPYWMRHQKRLQGRVPRPSGKFEHMLKHELYIFRWSINQFGTLTDWFKVLKKQIFNRKTKRDTQIRVTFCWKLLIPRDAFFAL